MRIIGAIVTDVEVVDLIRDQILDVFVVGFSHKLERPSPGLEIEVAASQHLDRRLRLQAGDNIPFQVGHLSESRRLRVVP